MVNFAYYGDRWTQHKPDTNGLSAEAEYQELTQALVKLTGHEYVADENGKLHPRAEREANFREGISLMNDRLKLGLDGTDVEMLALVYTALSEVARFGQNEHINPIKAENTGTHSLHTPLRANLLIRRGLERLGEEESRESVVKRQVAGLCLMPHDLGESLGEPGSLAMESQHANFQKDKPEAERLVMNAILRVAAHAVEEGDYSLFYDRLDEMKIPNMGETSPAQTNEEFLAQIRGKLGVPPEISLEGEGRVAIFSDFWDMQEHPGSVPNRFQGAEEKLNVQFLSQLAALSEHMQGEGHFLLFCNTGEGNDLPEGQVSWKYVQSKRQMSNLKYNEGEIGNLYAAANTPLEKAIALEAKKEVYEKSIQFLEEGADAVNRTATATSELKAGDPGRRAEIADLVKQSEAEGRELQAQGKGSEMRNVETKERLVAMYEWAMENDDFIPLPGQILAATPPAEYRFEEPKKGFAAKVTAEQAAPRQVGRGS